jgi:hypothetical protein
MIADITIEDLVKQTIPIYTKFNRHPVKGRSDCPLEVLYKQGLRARMLRELTAGEDRDMVVKRYSDKVKIL